MKRDITEYVSIGVKFPRYHGPPVTAENSGYNWFPPAANDWGTIHYVLDKAPPLQAKVEGPPALKEPIPRAIICTINFTSPG
jgi:hypothetical protein